MNEIAVEQKVEQKTEEHKAEHHKESFNFAKWIKGSSTKDYAENISFLIITISSIMVSLGIGLGSFIQGSISLGVFGALFVMLGIVIYIASQFIGEKNG